MFLNYLAEHQKIPFLLLAKKMIEADQKVVAQEEMLFEQLKQELGFSPENSLSEKAQINLEEIFDTFESRRVVILELTAIAYADKDFASEEKALIKELLKAFKISEKEYKKIEKWVIKQISLYKSACDLITPPSPG